MLRLAGSGSDVIRARKSISSRDLSDPITARSTSRHANIFCPVKKPPTLRKFIAFFMLRVTVELPIIISQ